ncbi:MAG: response regulator transcription factor [Clostridia bacterium]|nr:response regulator transcription factor [Clostridia bacterium]
MNRILVIEDEKSIAEMIKLCLTKNGYHCATANNGIVASELIEKYRYDLILLDIMLPDMDGFELIEYIKQFNIPVIFVTAKNAVADRVKGLRLGAEDYIIKPFDLQELLARIETVLRRFDKTKTIVEIGKIRIDTSSRTVLSNGSEASLSAKEFDLLLYLIRNKNIALHRENIYENVWNEPYYGDTRTVDLHIQRLKKKLQLGDAVEAIYKVGYKFSEDKLK